LAAIFRTVALPFGKAVVCDQAWWTAHIIAHHSILVGHEVDVEAVVHDPDLITQDTGFTNRRGFYKFNVNLDVFSPHLKVVVKISRFGRLSVVTAYPTNRVKAGESEIWRR